MAAVSSELEQVLRSSHGATCLVQVVDSAGTVVATVPVSAGSVSIDRGASIRRRVTLTVPAWDSSFVPGSDPAGLPGSYGGMGSTYAPDLPSKYGELFQAGRSLLGPAQGFEIRVWRGLDVGGGDYSGFGATYGSDTSHKYGTLFGTLLVPLGVFSVARAAVTDDGDGPVVEVEGYDRSRRVARARWSRLYTVRQGRNYAEAIGEMITSRVPGVRQSLVGTTRLTPLLVFGEERDNDPWSDARKMARNIGCDLFFDGEGTLRLLPEPDASADSVAFEFVEGDGCTMVDLGRTLDDERTYNHIVVVGEHPDLGVPIRIEAWDNDPASPTYRYGPYGTVTYFLTSAFITSVDQARDVARATLRRVMGVDEEVSVSAVPNPFLDAGDVVEVQRARAKARGRFVVQRVDMPLESDGLMTVIAKRQRAFIEDEEVEV